MPRRVALPLAVAALALAVLSGCVPDSGGDPSAAPTDQPTGSPTPSADPTDQPTGTPVDKTCDELVSPDTVFIYNPNFVRVDDFIPVVGSSAASALEHEGVACRWQNETNGQNIDVSVAQLDDESIDALKNTAFEDSQMVPTYGEEAYFTVGDDGVGVAQVFQGSFWIVAESPVFFEPGDAKEIVDSVIAAVS